jgi:uncharacterized protein involved in exopolysaccharide biosynthesis
MLQAELAVLSTSLLTPPGAERNTPELVGSIAMSPQMARSLQDLEQQLRLVQTRLTQETDRYNRLVGRRDLAQEAYDTLLRKEAELALAARVQSAEVRLTGPAVVTEEDGLPVLAYATVLGIALGVVAAFGLEYWQQYRAQAG